MEQERGTEEKDMIGGRLAKEMTGAGKEARKSPMVAVSAANMTAVAKTQDTGSKGKGKGKGKTHSQYCLDRGEQGHIGVNCLHKWTNNVDEDDHQSEQSPPCRMNLRRRSRKNSHFWSCPNDETESPGAEHEMTKDRHFTTLLRATRKSRCRKI